MNTQLPADEARKGLTYALMCYIFWGLFPIYWYPLNHSPIGADQLLAQRILWSAVFAVVFLLLSKQKDEFFRAVRTPKILATFTMSAFCISINWLVYLWAVTHNHVTEASLGYFTSPLFNIVLGSLIFKEYISRLQKIAVGLAVVGILWLAVPAGSIPWIALLLTLSFGFYGMVRKLAPLGALPGLVLETLIVMPFAALYLWYCEMNHSLVFSALSGLQIAILVGSGIATTVPLILFAAGAKRIPLSTLGIIQYVSPTIQLILGLTLFGEKFDLNRFIGYAWVWLGVVLYLFGIWQVRRKRHLDTAPLSH